MLQAECHRVSLHTSRHFVHEAFVSEGVLKPCGRSQRRRKKWRWAVVYQRSLRFDGPRSFRGSANVASTIGRHPIRAIIVSSRFWRGRPRCEGLRLKTSEHSGNHVPGSFHAGPVSANRRPAFVIPSDDIAFSIEPGALIDDKCETITLAPGHLVMARQLYFD